MIRSDRFAHLPRGVEAMRAAMRGGGAGKKFIARRSGAVSIQTSTRTLDHDVRHHVAAAHRARIETLPAPARSLLSLTSLEWHRHRFAPHSGARFSTYVEIIDKHLVQPIRGCGDRRWGHCDYCDHGRAIDTAARFLEVGVAPTSNFTIHPRYDRDLNELRSLAKRLLNETAAYRIARPRTRTIVASRALLVASTNRSSSAIHLHVVTAEPVSRHIVQAIAGTLGLYAEFDNAATVKPTLESRARILGYLLHQTLDDQTATHGLRRAEVWQQPPLNRLQRLARTHAYRDKLPQIEQAAEESRISSQPT